MDYTWDLSVLYKSFEDPQINADFASVEEDIAKINETLKDTEHREQVICACIDIVEKMSEKLECLGNYAQLTLAADANNEPAAVMADRLMQMDVQVQLANSAMVRYLGETKDLDTIIKGNEKLTEVAFALRRMQDAYHHLPAPELEEWLLRMSITGAQAFSQLRDKLDATLMVDYRGQSLPLAQVRNMADDADENVRRDAYEAEMAAYKKIEIPMAACLNGIKGEALVMIDAEHYDSVLDMSLDSSNMDRETLDAMFEAIKEFLPDFRAYLRKKGELLGKKDGLPFYDLFAPVAKAGYQPKKYTVEEAHDKLIKEMSKFTPEMGEFMDHAFKNRWIDMFPREGKGGGAFCASLAAKEQSRVLTNFVGSFGDVSTLAHELGHAWHNRCMIGLPAMLTGAPMPLAETASIFNETFLSHAVREGADEAELFTMLEDELKEATQVIVDIYSRFLFESAVIEQRKTHALSVNELKQMMLDAQDKSYGDGLDKEIRHPYMWANKSHYYIPGLAFYNFPYAFGLLFGTGVFAQYQKQGAAFVPVYNKLLRSCGSGMVADVAASVGINVRDIEFWRSSLRVIKEDIDLFLKLA